MITHFPPFFNNIKELLCGDEIIEHSKTYNITGLHLEQILQSHANLEARVDELVESIKGLLFNWDNANNLKEIKTGFELYAGIKQLIEKE